MSPSLVSLVVKAVQSRQVGQNHHDKDMNFPVGQSNHSKDHNRPVGQSNHSNYHKSFPGWAIAVIVIVSLLVIGIVAYGAMWWMKRHKYKKANMYDVNADNAEDFDHSRIPMTEAELWEAEERERSKMIRKSLASRTEYRSSSSNLENPFADRNADRNADRLESGQVGDYYKNWEADQARRDTTRDNHPALSPTPPSASPTRDSFPRPGLSPPPQKDNPFN